MSNAKVISLIDDAVRKLSDEVDATLSTLRDDVMQLRRDVDALQHGLAELQQLVSHGAGATTPETHA